jgi:hypothetical protein
MFHPKMSPFEKIAGLALPIALMLCGCDSADSHDASDRSGGVGEAGGSGAAVGSGGFTPDPTCEYDCVSPADDDQVCVQTCAGGCVTVVMSSEVSTDEGVDATGSLAEFCPGDFPEPHLWELTCELLFAEPSGGPGDCFETFSEASCAAAFDMCLPSEM